MRIVSIRPSAALAALGLFLLTSAAPAQKKEIIQLQRDMAILQDTMRQMDRGSSERFAVLEALLKQSLDQTEKLNAALAVIEKDVGKQSDALVVPLTRSAAKVDTLANQFGALRAAVDESNAMLTKLQQEVADIKNQLTTLPPPGEGSAGGAAAGSGGGETFGETFFTSAVSDYNRGNYELSRAQFMDFLRYSSGSPRAPEAQYYLGAIAYDQGRHNEAVKQFDLVLEKYPVGMISADAQYKKAMALLKLDKKEAAAQELEAVVARFPNSNVAPNAKGMLDELRGAGGMKPSPLKP